MTAPLDLRFVRHAPVEAKGTCYGHHPVAVKVTATQVADGIVSNPELAGVRVVHSSPLARCAEPAALIARALGARLALDARIKELSMGRWEGRTWEAIERDDGDAYRAWMARWRELPPPGGETTSDIADRVRAWWTETAPDASHLLVAHAGVIRALLVVVRDLSWDDAMSTSVPHLELERLSTFAHNA